MRIGTGRYFLDWVVENAEEWTAGRESPAPTSPTLRKRKPALLAPITLHECRHTFASLLIDAGVNPKALSTFMGHGTIEMTFGQYGHE